MTMSKGNWEWPAKAVSGGTAHIPKAPPIPDDILTTTFGPIEDYMTNTEKFDAAIKTVTQERGAEYGHPADDFAKANLIKQAVKGCPDPEVRHALEMIGVKMSRLAQTPDHLDSAIDIAGYARTIAMVLDRRLMETAAGKMVADGFEHAREIHKEFEEADKIIARAFTPKTDERYIGPGEPERTACCDHASDCAVHNEPAMPAGECDCPQQFRHTIDLDNPRIGDTFKVVLDCGRIGLVRIV